MGCRSLMPTGSRSTVPLPATVAFGVACAATARVLQDPLYYPQSEIAS
ncbi:hypothetical protein HMPREF0758_3246 [Serratia odorifera DSM 4582]|uniref:Uncharacterized protein n=1 Tax=Serratia odorifera DSM 4582 TaxID=667129 RepID=D4E4Z6_SEROD|nr:hypothetical protein HMPREF0758_3246 [Serratia odorifera DSM 4582]